MGYQLTFYTIKGTTTDNGLYLNHSFSNNIRYGIEFYNNGNTQDIFHHVAYRLGSLFKESPYHLMFSGSINYLSQSTPTIENKQVHEGSLTTTWAPKQSPFRIHASAARKQGSNEVITIGALSFQKKWGTLAIEWDSNYLNLSSQFEINNRLNFRGGITKNTNDNSELVFKTSIGFIDRNNFMDNQRDSKTNEKSTEEKTTTVNASIGLMHIQEGLQFFYSGDYRKAQKSYEIATEFFPESSKVKERLGSIYFKLGEYEKAQIEWEKANVLAPSDQLKEYIKEAKEKEDSMF